MGELTKKFMEKVKKPDPSKIHIISTFSRWAVTKEGLYEPIEIFNTQKEALRYAKEQENIKNIVVHNKLGGVLKIINVR